MRSRRPQLGDVGPQPTTHAGLWLDRYLLEQTGPDGDAGRGAKADHIANLAGHPIPIGYPEAFDRWEVALHQAGARIAILECTGRMVIGLGSKGVLEAGIHLDHTWGVPVLPGSALKGLAARTADLLLDDSEWRRGRVGGTEEKGAPIPAVPRGKSHCKMFGSTDERGVVIFHDAWWIPKDATALPLHLDVMTVHHQDYYQNSNPPPPADWDSPNPVAFTTANGRYLLAVSNAQPDDPEGSAWLETAVGIVELGLRELGIGAKTNAGYGRLRVIDGGSGLLPRTESHVRPAGDGPAPRELATVHRPVTLGPENIDRLVQGLGKNNSPAVLEHLAQLPSQLHALYAKKAIARFDSIDRKYLRDKADKAWVKALLAAAGT